MTATNRRHFMLRSGLGAGAIALSSLTHGASSESKRAAIPHFAGRAKNVIFLFMSGGPSQVDTFDPKPELARLAGKDVPDSLAANVPKIKRAGLKNLMASPWEFRNHGQSGIPVSSLFPEVAKHVDDLCLIRSLQHNNPVHGPGECVALTGTSIGDRPSVGAWSVYGLGSESANLPAFLTMNLHSDGMQFPQASGWGTGFLPARYQGTVVDPAKGIQHVALPSSTTNRKRQDELKAIKWFNNQHQARIQQHNELEARIRSYDLAFRLQTSAPELFELNGETNATKYLYGMDQSESSQVGRSCLLARRMVERGVRFVQIRVGGWDAHGNIKSNHNRMAARTDKPIAALLTDLKQRGLLDSTLVVWGGEFGRTPTMEGKANGRDHSPAGYTVWMAGGGAKGGRIIGQTDPIGYVAIERPVSIHDFHATILYSLGLNAEQLTYNHHGRDEIPTVFGGAPVKEVFA